MNLEPGRSSLSGRPEFLKPAQPARVATIGPLERVCSLCRVRDVAQMVDGEPHHSVTLELRFLEAKNEADAKQKISGYLAARGWRYKFHLGRFAMERDVCRTCLMAHREMEQEFKRKKSNELKSNLNSESYYLALCGD